MAKPIKVTILGDASSLERTFRQVDAAVSGLDTGFSRFGRTVAGAFAGVQIGQFLRSSMDAASDLNESVSKVGVVFGQSAGQIRQWAEGAAENLGMSKRQALEAAGTFGNLFTAMKIGTPAALAMSKGIVQLATDLASFNNASPAETLEALRAGLVGETEPLRRFGVNLNAATIEAKAMELGLAATKGELTAGAKAQAAYALIMEQTSTAQGDFARTAEGAANQQRTLAAEFENAKAELGQALLPLLLNLVDVGRSLTPALVEVGEKFAGMAEMAGLAAGPVGDVLRLLAGSDLVAFAATAAAAGLAIEKIGTASLGAVKAVADFAARANPIVLGVSAVVGGAAAVYMKLRERGEEAAAQQDRLAEAFLEAADPAFVLTDQLRKTVDALEATARAAGPASEGVEAMADPLRVLDEVGPGVTSTLSKIGVTAQDIGRAITEGRVPELIERIYEASRKLPGTIESPIGTRFTVETEEAAEAVRQLGKNAEAARRENAEAAKGELERAVALGALKREALDAALADAKAADETGRWLEAGEQLLPGLEAQAQATQQATQATQDNAAATQAAKDETDGFINKIGELRKAQEDQATQGRDQEEQLDRTRDAIFKVGETAKDVKTTSLDPMSDAGRRNRDAFREVVDQAGGFVQAVAEAGGTADVQKQHLHNLAAEAEQAALSAGFGADEARRLADEIRNIPTYTQIDVVSRYWTEIHGGAPNLAAAQHGGSGMAGGWTMVGERGPEVVRLPKGSSVEPNHAGVGPAPDITINVHQTNASGDEIARALGWELRKLGGRW